MLAHLDSGTKSRWIPHTSSASLSLFVLAIAVLAIAVLAVVTECSLKAQDRSSQSAAEEVTFPSGKLTLHGFLYKGAGDGPLPAILWNHGSERRPGRLPELGAFFSSKGYVFFVPHRRGQGRSANAGPYVMDVLRGEGGSTARSARLVEMMEVHLQDQLAALAYLRSLPFVDPKRIAVMGCSFGGIQTLLAAESAPDIRAAVDFAGGAESWQGSPDLRGRMMSAARHAKVPVFFIQAEGDYDLAPSRTLAKEMEKAGKDAMIHIYPAVGRTPQENHEFCVHGVEVWGPDVVSFIEKAFGGTREK
jgi:dipeptidyl aminopeptidase/acylaminoacyl peptidase